MSDSNIRLISTDRLAYSQTHGPHEIFVEAMRRRTDLICSREGKKWKDTHNKAERILLEIIRGYYAMRAS